MFISLLFSCCGREPLLDRDDHRDLFLRILEQVRRRYRLVVLRYVVMPEHVHLLVSEPQRDTLSTAIQALKLGFVRSLDGDGVGDAGPRSRKGGETWGTRRRTGVSVLHFSSRYFDLMAAESLQATSLREWLVGQAGINVNGDGRGRPS